MSLSRTFLNRIFLNRIFSSKKPLNKISLITLLLLSVNAYALESDKTSPILIEASQVDISEKSGVSTYRGDVRLTQGSVKINADSIVVYTQDKKLSRIVANGKPATFSQQPNEQHQRVEASANEVEFTSITGLLILKYDAKLKQGTNSFSSNKIVYDTVNDIMSATSSEKSNQRVRAVIQPNTFDDASGNENKNASQQLNN